MKGSDDRTKTQHLIFVLFDEVHEFLIFLGFQKKFSPSENWHFSC